jgi:predicted MFS family arabinose efflux permease
LVALTGAIWPAMAALALPGAAAMAILVWMRRRIGEPANDTLAARTDQPRPDDAPYPDQLITDKPHDDEPRPERSPAPHLQAAPVRRTVLPRTCWLFAASSGAATAGLVTFGVISFHLAHERVVSLAAIPVVYAAGMAVAAVAALATGFSYDRIRGKVLYVLPILAAAVPWLAFTDRAGLALLGVLVWGAANGIQDSTVKALVADLVPPGRRATAYGIFAAIQGAGAVAGGTLAGALYARSIPLLGASIAAIEAVALVLYIATLRRSTEEPA